MTAFAQLFAAFIAFLAGQGAQVNVVVDGDSLSSGYQIGLSAAYPSIAQAALPAGYLTFEDIAIAGETLQTMEANVSTAVCPLIAAAPKPQIPIVSIWGGSNDILADYNPTALLTVAQNYYQAAKACGAKYVIAWTVIPRNSAFTFVEPNRLTYNAGLRSSYKSMGADYLIDVGADPVIGAPGPTVTLNPVYFLSDNVHLTAFSHSSIIGPYYFAQALQLLASP